MRAGQLLLAFTASIILGTADIVHNPHTDFKPKFLGRPDVPSTVEISDAVLSHGLGPVQASTDGALGARLIDSSNLEKRRGRSSRGGRTKKTRPTRKKTSTKKKTTKKKTSTKKKTQRKKNTQKKKQTQKKKKQQKKKPIKSCPLPGGGKGKTVKTKVHARDLIGRTNTRSKTAEQCRPICRKTINRVGEDPCDEYKNHKDFVKCAPASQFTLDYFKKAAFKKPRADKCLFYTNGLSDIAQAYGKTHGLITIWDIWGGKLMKWSPHDLTNPMRCIIANDMPIRSGNRNSIRQKYFSDMSEAMASMCSGKVTFMDRNLKTNSYGRVKQAGIWGHTEFPRLRNDGKATSIDAIGMHTSTDTQIRWENWWVHGMKTWPNEATKPAGILDQ